jgi:NCS1 family nucleobase:cation symporter-1
LIALAAGILPNLPGFLGTIKVASVGAFWMKLYNYAWFVGFAISFAVYAILMMGEKQAAQSAPAAAE